VTRPHVRLIELIERHTSFDGDSPTLDRVNLLHSLLGSLRNMCIAAGARVRLVDAGALAVAATCVAWPNLEVNFKSLAVVRLLVRSVKGEAQMAPVCDERVLEAVCGFARRCEHVGVRNEAVRLVAYLALAAAKFPPLGLFAKLARLGAVDVLVELVASEHVLMVNEALLALNVFANFAFGECGARLGEMRVLDALMRLLERRDLPVEMQLNVFKLVTCLVEQEGFVGGEQVRALEAFFGTLLAQAPNDVVRAFASKILQISDKQN